MSMVLYDAVSLIFVQRTMALYSWSAGWRFRFRFCTCSLSHPLPSACPSTVKAIAFQAPDSVLTIPAGVRCATLVANIVFKSLSMILDITLLVLTCIGCSRVACPPSGKRSGTDLFSHINDRSLSGFLLRQGFHFYLIQFSTDVLFVSTYFSFSDISYQCLATALIFTIPPIAAASAFRNMGKKASQVEPQASLQRARDYQLDHHAFGRQLCRSRCRWHRTVGGSSAVV